MEPDTAVNATPGLDALLACLANSPPPLPPPPQPPFKPARTLPFGVHTNGQPPPPNKKRKLPFASGAAKAPVPQLALPPATATVYTRSAGEADELCASIHALGLPLIGLDIEWKVSFEANSAPRPTAVLQIATPRTVYVFQLSAMRGAFPPRLQRLLEDGALVKAGNKIGNDCLKLRRDFGLRVTSLLDLGELARRALAYGDRPWSLADLCEATLSRRLPKELRMSDWESSPLGAQLLEYAALDAWASREVCCALLRRLPPGAPGEPGESADARLLRAMPARLLEDTPADPMVNRT